MKAGRARPPCRSVSFEVVDHVFDVFESVVVAAVFVEVAVLCLAVQLLLNTDPEADGVQFLHHLRRTEGAAADADLGVAFVEQFFEHLFTVNGIELRLYKIVDDPFGAVLDADAG